MSDEDLRHTSCESQSEKAKHHGEGRDIPSQIGKLSETERQVYWRRSPRGRHAAERRLNGVAYEYAAPREESHSHFSIRKAARDSFVPPRRPDARWQIWRARSAGSFGRGQPAPRRETLQRIQSAPIAFSSNLASFVALRPGQRASTTLSLQEAVYGISKSPPPRG